jgi:hypothetical protein
MAKRIFAVALLCAGFFSSVTGFASIAITNNDDPPGLSIAVSEPSH